MPRKKRNSPPEAAVDGASSTTEGPPAEPSSETAAESEQGAPLTRRQQRALMKAEKAASSDKSAASSTPPAAAAVVPTMAQEDPRAVEQRLKRLLVTSLPRSPCFVSTGPLEEWARKALQGGTSTPGDLCWKAQRNFGTGVPNSGAVGAAAQPPRLHAHVVKGLQNNANACYMAGVLQAIVHCPPIASALVAASTVHLVKSKAATPAASVAKPPPPPLAAQLGEWVQRYWASSTVAAVPLPKCFASGAIRLGAGVVADGAHQEDAGEFLQSLLKAIDASLVSLGIKTPSAAPPASSTQQRRSGGGGRGAQPAEAQPAGTERGWLTVGKGKERLTVRSDAAAAAAGEGTAADAKLPPLAGQVLNGTLRVNTKNSKGSARGVTSVVVEPFMSLTVPVSAPNRRSPGSPPTVVDCIVASLAKESVEDAEGRDIRRNASFGTLPSVLIVQLARWAVTREGDVVKLSNRVQLSASMTIPKEHITGAAAGAEYKLQSIVCHRGDSPASGHYVTYVVHGTTVSSPAVGEGEASMAIANDARVQRAPLTQCLHEAEDDTPYLVVYAR